MNPACPPITTAWSLLSEQAQTPQTIVTFCEKLDQVLGGGIHLGRITELAGPSAIGKTQICFQLAVDVQIPQTFGGIGGGAVYIDTEGSYAPKRLEDIANAAVHHINDIAVSPELKSAVDEFTLESLLNNIFVKRCLDLPSLVKTVHEMEQFVKSHPKVKLIIVDSFAFHFRDDQMEIRDRRCLLLKSILALAKVASRYGVSVVAVNQMTTRFTIDGEGYEEPALNHTLTQNVGDQLILGWRRRKKEDSEIVDRCALLYKSSHRRRALATFQICTEGVRDI